jgi:adenosylhomocysteine nucleosidase
MICYAFPLAHEAAPLVKICTQKESFSIGELRCTLGNFNDRPVLIALVGMGQETARARVKDIFTYFQPGVLVLAGYGGALVPQLKVGQVVVSTNYSSADVVSFLRLLTAFVFGDFCTADEIAGTREERDRAARAGDGQVIEMETAAVAEVVFDHEVPFVAVRAISDDYGDTLPVRALAAGFDPAQGRATPLRLLAHLATHWREVRPFIHFVSNLSVARRNLTSFLRQVNDDLPRNY